MIVSTDLPLSYIYESLKKCKKVKRYNLKFLSKNSLDYSNSLKLIDNAGNLPAEGNRMGKDRFIPLVAGQGTNAIHIDHQYAYPIASNRLQDSILRRSHIVYSTSPSAYLHESQLQPFAAFDRNLNAIFPTSAILNKAIKIADQSYAKVKNIRSNVENEEE